MCVCVCVCVCNPLKKHVVANSALVTVNVRDAPKLKFWAETENSGCARSKTKTENAL